MHKHPCALVRWWAYLLFSKSKANILNETFKLILENRMRPFLPKHQKLILQCYPPGRVTEKKPNPSELSYFLYYASTRRIKLDKVGAFLERKGLHDINRGKAGNVGVTLDIFDALMVKCKENLNVFAHNVVNVLKAVTNSKDLSLCEHGVKVFGTLCLELDSGLFSGDRDFVTSFNELGNDYINLATNPTGANAAQWTIIGLIAARHISVSTQISSTVAKELVPKIIKLVLSNLPNKSGEKLLNLVSRIKLQPENRQSLDVPSSLHATRTISNMEEITDDNDTPSIQQQLEVEAMQSLNKIFTTNNTTQIIQSTEVVKWYILKFSKSETWSQILIETITKWVPVQLRFAIVTSLVSSSNDETIFENQLRIVKLTTALLSSSVNMIGLSVIDILRQLLNRQKTILNTPIENEDLKNELLLELSNCISSLAIHIYYFDQISDMVSDILLRCYTNEVDLPKTNADDTTKNVINDEVNDRLLDQYIMDVELILRVCSQQKADVQRAKVPLERWDISFPLFNHKSSSIRSSYFSLFLFFLSHEVKKSETELNYSKYVGIKFQSMKKNSLSSLFHQIYLLSLSPTSSNDEFNIVDKLIENLILHYGSNAIVCGIPYFDKLQKVAEEHKAASIGSTKTLALPTTKIVYNEKQIIDMFSISTLFFFRSAVFLNLPNFMMIILDQIEYQKIWGPGIPLPTKNGTVRTNPNKTLKLENLSKIHPFKSDLIKEELGISSIPKELLANCFGDPDDQTNINNNNELSSAKSFNLLIDTQRRQTVTTGAPGVVDASFYGISYSPSLDTFSTGKSVKQRPSSPKVMDLKHVISSTQSTSSMRSSGMTSPIQPQTQYRFPSRQVSSPKGTNGFGKDLLSPKDAAGNDGDSQYSDPLRALQDIGDMPRPPSFGSFGSLGSIGPVSFRSGMDMDVSSLLSSIKLEEGENRWKLVV